MELGFGLTIPVMRQVATLRDWKGNEKDFVGLMFGLTGLGFDCTGLKLGTKGLILSMILGFTGLLLTLGLRGWLPELGLKLGNIGPVSMFGRDDLVLEMPGLGIKVSKTSPVPSKNPPN